MINSLFTPKNNTIDFKWYVTTFPVVRYYSCSNVAHIISDYYPLYRLEITHASTDSLKWDGFGLPVGNEALAASVVTEFAGGIKTSTITKKISDEVKRTSNALNVVDGNACINKANNHAKVYCLLYYGE